MTKSLRKTFNKEVVSSIQEDILTRRANYYYFLGGVEPWVNPAGDLDPNFPLDETALGDREIRRQMAYVKRVTPGDASLVVREIPWESGKVYAEWDDTVDLSDKDFYVMNDEYEVFKCLDNNYGALSTVCPRAPAVDPITTADGYIWKYLYTVPISKRRKFVALRHIPVQRSLSDSFYGNGAIDSVTVVEGGSGYIDILRTFVTINGPTTGTGAVLELDSVNAAGSITGVNVVNGGSGYTLGAKIVFNGTGIGAVASPVLGKITSFTVANGGSGYSYADTIQISAPDDPRGIQATASLDLDNGSVIGAFISNSGSGYTGIPVITILSATGVGAVLEVVTDPHTIASIFIESGGFGYDVTTAVSAVVGGASCVASVSRETGSITNVTIIDEGAGYTGQVEALVTSSNGEGTGLYGNPTAVLVPVIYNGKLQRVAIKDPGKNYPTDNDTTIVVSGSGTGAKLSPVIYEGKIIDVVIEGSGFGYTDVKLSVQSGTGTGAQLSVNILTSDLKSDQAYVEQTAVDGAIHNIKVVSGGTLYSALSTVVIEGNGEGCTAVPVINNGVVERINITKIGKGYTYASAKIVDPLRTNPNGDIPDAVLRVIISPAGGHGKDAVKELFTNTVSLTANLRANEVKLSENNDFRMFGVLKNPLDLFSGSYFKANSVLLAYKVVIDSVDGIQHDDIMWAGKNRFRVMAIGTDTITLVPIDSLTAIPLGELQSLDKTSAYYAYRVVGDTPSLDKYSGDLIFVTTDDPFSVTEEQNIIARTLLKLN